MAWWALYETATGRLRSVCAQVAEPLPEGLTAAPLAQRPGRAMVWDASTRAFVAAPAKVLVDRLDDLIADPDFATAWAGLNAARRTALRTALIRVLGSRRYRAPGETLTL